jgi:hypothetical protein
MPLYEYKVHRLWARVRGAHPEGFPARGLPSCAGASVERLLSMFAVSSESSRQSNTESAYRYNNKLNAKQEPDKREVQIEHKHQH